MKIAYLVGSASVNSLNRQLANTILELAPEGVEFVEAQITELPIYNRDYDGNFPEAALKLKELLREADGVLFITPEHNRTFSALLHNAIEWSSRPAGDWPLTGKPVGTIGTAASGIGTGFAQRHLRDTLLFLNPKIMVQPEAYIDATRTGQLEDGAITNEVSRGIIANYIKAFVEFVEANK